MKELNDSAVLPEEEGAESASADAQKAGTAPSAVQPPKGGKQPGTAADSPSEETEETKRFPVAQQDEENTEFLVKKLDADGTWKPQSVSVTDAAAPEDRPEVWEDPEEQDEEDAEPAEAERSRRPRRPGGAARYIVGAVAAVVVVAIGAFSLYVYQYPSIFPGVRVAGEYALSGMSEQEAETYIAGECSNSILENNVQVNADGQQFTLRVGDVTDQVDSESTAQAAYLVGREGGYFERTGAVLRSIFRGQNISLDVGLDEDKLTEFVAGVHTKVEYDPTQPSWKISITEKTLTIDTGATGLDFDQKQVVSDLSSQIGQNNFAAYDVATYITDQDKPDAAAIAKDVNRDPENATVDKETEEVIKAKAGVQVEESAIADTIGDTSEQTYTVPIETTKAKISGSDLKKVLFRDTLASSTTYYDSGETSRTNNVTLSTEACDGVILNPGEEFSYNDVVGERTAERGYSTGIIFLQGQKVEDMGGGVCQCSSTIYMAVLRADLDVTERANHQFQISYTPIAQDATVAWGSQDFKFVNNTDYPVKVITSVGGGELTVTIVGTKTDDKEVSLYSETSTGSTYKTAVLYKTVTVNGESTTTVENESYYLLEETTTTDESDTEESN